MSRFRASSLRGFLGAASGVVLICGLPNEGDAQTLAYDLTTTAFTSSADYTQPGFSPAETHDGTIQAAAPPYDGWAVDPVHGDPHQILWPFVAGETEVDAIQLINAYNNDEVIHHFQLYYTTDGNPTLASTFNELTGLQMVANTSGDGAVITGSEVQVTSSSSITTGEYRLHFDTVAATAIQLRTFAHSGTGNGNFVLSEISMRSAIVGPGLDLVKLIESSGSALDNFGISVAIDGDTLVVATTSGAAVFEKPPSGWFSATETAMLTAAGGAGGFFGHSVSISDDTIVVGAYQHYATGPGGNYATGPGAAYVYDKPASGWVSTTETAKLTASDGSSDDLFGWAVSIDGDTIVAGAIHNDLSSPLCPDCGAAYLFEKPAGGWSSMTETAKLAPRTGWYSHFGSSVAISDDTVVVGARKAGTFCCAAQGLGYVFEKPPTGWATTGTYATWLSATDGSSGDYLGTSIAIDGDTVVVGAGYASSGCCSRPGAAYLFERPASGWNVNGTSEVAKLIASDGGNVEQFGSSVAIEGHTVVVGAPAAGVVGNAFQGATYLFHEPATGWADSPETSKLTAADGVAGDRFGWVAFDGTTALVGAIHADIGGNVSQGAAYVFTGVGVGAPALLGEYDSAKSVGDTGNDQGYDIAVDAAGNVYTTGSFEGTVDFDPGAGISSLTSAGSRDIFVTKLDADHNFLWAIATDNIGWDEGYGIEVDAAGNVYITGGRHSSAIIQKLDTDGSILWSENVTGAIATALAVDASDNVYTTGYFPGTVDFDPGAGVFNLTSAGYNDIFVQKLDADGNFLWAKQMGGTSTDEGYGIAVDASGFVYATGLLDWDIFVQKLDFDGTLIWDRQMGGGSYDTGTAIAVDASGHVYTTGRFSDTADFNPGAGTDNLTSSGAASVFVSTLDASGNFLWAKQLGDISADNYKYDIAVDTLGNVYTTGSFVGTADFDPGAGEFSLTSAGESDIFVSQLDSSGDFLWAGQMGGAGDDEGHGIALASSGVVYTTGYFQDTADFDPGAGVVNLTSAGASDIFVSKLSRDATAPVVTVDALVTNDTTPELTGTIDDASAVIHVTVAGSYPTQTHPATNNGITWTLADNTLSAITPGVREVTVAAWDSSGNAATDATYNELTILGAVAGPVTSNLLTPGQFVSGARLELTAPSGTNYQWKKNGVNLTDAPPRVTGTTSQTLIIDPLEASDSGAYTVEYQAGGPAPTALNGLLETDPFDVAVDLFDVPGSSPPSALPTAAVPVLMVLGVLLALTGAWGVRRRRVTDN